MGTSSKALSRSNSISVEAPGEELQVNASRGQCSAGILSGLKVKGQFDGFQLGGTGCKFSFSFSPNATETGRIIRTRMLFLLD